MTSPYNDLPNHQFWRRSIARVEAHRVDPMIAPRFRVGSADRVVTAGSCFAQHIARRLVDIGHGFHITERGEHLPEPKRREHGYGVFSARFGNIYTAAQLRQLLDECLGRHAPGETHLVRPDGRLVDPWRQQVEPDGFATFDDMCADRARHLAAVERMVREADVFVFTLGLTEGWRARADGSVYSTAPGVVAGAFDPERDEFVNFGVDEVRGDLIATLTTLKEVNPGIRVILTVSPVPLIATYERRSVLVSTSYSKAVLRVAAEEALRRFEWVDYFPSYEIITGSFAGGLYYESDHREVNRLGVAHAMRCFVANFVETAGNETVPDTGATPRLATHMAPETHIVCDEETLDGLRF
ncbi:MAG: GSCFA domain-containing protein [Candidatus Sphingomonas phytovorans]|nr:GSCFA domain-containing protein [Sphingomonas sp.]WEJ99503.1 MAG: GSCFA domain-containing protein [Sphingomonas sp.]